MDADIARARRGLSADLDDVVARRAFIASMIRLGRWQELEMPIPRELQEKPRQDIAAQALAFFEDPQARKVRIRAGYFMEIEARRTSHGTMAGEPTGYRIEVYLREVAETIRLFSYPAKPGEFGTFYHPALKRYWSPKKPPRAEVFARAAGKLFCQGQGEAERLVAAARLEEAYRARFVNWAAALCEALKMEEGRQIVQWPAPRRFDDMSLQELASWRAWLEEQPPRTEPDPYLSAPCFTGFSGMWPYLVFDGLSIERLRGLAKLDEHFFSRWARTTLESNPLYQHAAAQNERFRAVMASLLPSLEGEP